MDDWKNSFLLGWPIFRAMLVSGSVAGRKKRTPKNNILAAAPNLAAIFFGFFFVSNPFGAEAFWAWATSLSGFTSSFYTEIINFENLKPLRPPVYFLPNISFKSVGCRDLKMQMLHFSGKTRPFWTMLGIWFSSEVFTWIKLIVIVRICSEKGVYKISQKSKSWGIDCGEDTLVRIIVLRAPFFCQMYIYIYTHITVL